MNVRVTQENIITAAQAVWDYGKKYHVWAFHAQMGGGKTTFISALCRHILQVKDVVSSPTFSIINQYLSPVAGIIYHMDWYRLKSEEEAVQAGVEDVLAGNNLCLVEWPEVAPGLLPDNCLHLYMEVSTAERLIRIE